MSRFLNLLLEHGHASGPQRGQVTITFRKSELRVLRNAIGLLEAGPHELDEQTDDEHHAFEKAAEKIRGAS